MLIVDIQSLYGLGHDQLSVGVTVYHPTFWRLTGGESSRRGADQGRAIHASPRRLFRNKRSTVLRLLLSYINPE